MTYIYRQLSAADVVGARQLLAMFGNAFDDLPTYQHHAPDDAYLQELLGKSSVIVLVAEHESVVVGGLVAYELEKIEQARSEIYIYDLAVAEPHRRNGIATRLIRELQAIGRVRGAWVIFVQADPGDDPAIALYESLGVREDVHHFDIAVE